MDLKEKKDKLSKVTSEIKKKREYIRTTLDGSILSMSNSKGSEDIEKAIEVKSEVERLREEIKELEETQRELKESISEVEGTLKDGEDKEEDIKEEKVETDSEEGETSEEEEVDNKEEEDKEENKEEEDSSGEGIEEEEEEKGDNKGSDEEMGKVFENGKDKDKKIEGVKYGREQFVEGFKTLALQNNYDPTLAEDVLKTTDDDKMAILIREDDKVIDNRDRIEYLHKQVDKKNVNAGKGKVFFLDNLSADPIPEVAEGEPAPRAGFYSQNEFEYEIKEFRDKRDYTLTLKEDSKNGGGEIYDWMVARRDLTREMKLYSILDETYEATVVNTFDELKTIKNVKLSNRLRKVAFYLDVTAFDILDRVKDAHGNYLLKSDVTSETGTSLLGFPVYKYENLGEGIGYVGSIGTAVKLLDRQQDSVRIGEDLDRASEVVYSRTRFNYIVARENALVKFDVNGIQDLGVEVSDGNGEEEPTP